MKNIFEINVRDRIPCSQGWTEINPIGDNTDYRLHFILDEPRTAIFALFRRDGKEKEYLLDENGEVAVPLWVLKRGVFEVGLTSDGYATAPLAIWVIGSIKDKSGEPAEEIEQAKIDQLIALVNTLKGSSAATAPYEGEYETASKITADIVLETQSKFMKQNVTVRKMPQFEVSNEEGGKTLILGDEYYGN